MLKIAGARFVNLDRLADFPLPLSVGRAIGLQMQDAAPSRIANSPAAVDLSAKSHPGIRKALKAMDESHRDRLPLRENICQ